MKLRNFLVLLFAAVSTVIARADDDLPSASPVMIIVANDSTQTTDSYEGSAPLKLPSRQTPRISADIPLYTSGDF